MEAPQKRDYLLVTAYVALLFALVLAVGGPLTMHEGVLSQTTRAMLADHDWLVPHYGDAPWIERPPLPQWISCAICALIGHCDQEWNVRIAPALAGLATTLLTLWIGGRLFGRAVGIVSGLMLATMYNFLRYSTLAEADIMLAPIVAGVLGVFACIEIPLPNSAPVAESLNPWGGRRWLVLLFFVLLGATNLVKGLVFGTVIALAPVGMFLLWNLRWRSIARYCWVWGVLAFFAVALPWPIAVGLRDPGAVEVWKFDLFGRLNNGYLAEPWWYYFACLMWVPQPWSLLAFLGLGLTFKKAFKDGSPADRFVWCWAWMPILVFSLSQGKHHHYMLHYLAPWAILAAQAGVWAWQAIGEHWQRRWFVPACTATLGNVAIVLFASRLPGPSWLLPGLLVALPLFVIGLWWLSLDRRHVVALTGTFACVFVLYVGAFLYKSAYLHRSREDTAFLRKVRETIPLDQPLMINSADEALEGLRMQFYIGDTVYFLHNLSFVLDDRVHGSEVYVVTRFNRMPELEKYGKVEPLFRCEQSRRERDETDRWTLFRLTIREDLERKNARCRITPMQAMYREWGPDLDKK